MIYVIGSLKNPKVEDTAHALRAAGFTAFDEWFAAGPNADKHWNEYAKKRGLSYREALALPLLETVFQFDVHHLNTCIGGVLVMPAGKSAHAELGYLIGSGKPVWILHDGEPKGEWELMPKFATGMAYSLDELLPMMKARLL